MPKRVVNGTVVSDKGSKTLVVRVERAFKHPLYGKTIRMSKKYHAHNEGTNAKLGDVVQIQECRPVSKLKCWEVIGVLRAASAAEAEAASGE